MVASGENFGLFPNSMPTSNSGTTEDILKILNPNVNTIRHMVMRNTMIKIFSLTNPVTEYNNGLKSILMDEVSTSISNGPLLKENLDWLRAITRCFTLGQVIITHANTKCELKW